MRSAIVQQSSDMEAPRDALVRFLMRISAACLLVLGSFGCHDFLVSPPQRFLPDGLQPTLMFIAPMLAIPGIVLLIASFAGTKAAKFMLIVGSCFFGLGGLVLLLSVQAPGKGTAFEGRAVLFIFGVIFLLIPGVVVAAIGAVLRAIQRRSGSKKIA